jgi:sarcosine oxidase subunit delta
VRPGASGADAESAFVDYVYLRANRMGLHRELWYHGLGCQSWLVVERDTRTHEISACFPAGGDVPGPAKADA